MNLSLLSIVVMSCYVSVFGVKSDDQKKKIPIVKTSAKYERTLYVEFVPLGKKSVHVVPSVRFDPFPTPGEKGK